MTKQMQSLITLPGSACYNPKQTLPFVS